MLRLLARSFVQASQTHSLLHIVHKWDTYLLLGLISPSIKWIPLLLTLMQLLHGLNKILKVKNLEIAGTKHVH